MKKKKRKKGKKSDMYYDNPGHTGLKLIIRPSKKVTMPMVKQLRKRKAHNKTIVKI